MAAILRSAAAKTANRGQPSSFYNKDKTNPVFQSLDQETKKFMGYMRKRNAAGYVKPSEEPSSRPSDTLFDLWNKYEPKLPKEYYQNKLLEMGDFLVSVKEYSLALWQCYDRYLMHIGNLNVEEITDVETFKKIFFPGGFQCDNAGLTFRALMGKSISMYQMVKAGDPKLQNMQSVERCVLILNFLRLVMQVVLPKESLCWLVYNGTVHIYSISRHLMSLGHSASVVEYLLWACMCMETSVPLLAVKYLSWRSTLYTAVSQCYFDCKQSHHAEAFARRGLAKINELSNLENLSSAIETPQTELAFRAATVKMAIMVFKRSAYETRRKPKALLRPKTRANLKDAAHLPWPRTPSEKLLADMFEGSGAQFLCILESLNDTNRRILLTSTPASDSEVEILDVYAELFMAGQEILAGGGGHRGASIKPQSSVHLPALAGVVKDKSLMDIATAGEDGVTIDGAIRLVKMAYCFEQWEAFDMMIENILTYLRIINEDKYAWDEKALELLLAMEKVNPSRRYKRNMTSVVEDENKERETTNPPTEPKPESQAGQSTKSFNMNDELIQVAEVLMTIVHGPFLPAQIEVDMIVDAALFLWNRTKSVFQKHQSGSADNPKYLQKMENPSKWVYILDVVHKVLCWCGISSVDPALTAEVVLRLALVFESSAHIDEGKSGIPRSKFGRQSTKLTQDDESTLASFRMSYREGISALRGSKTSLSDMQPEGSQHHLVSRTSMLSSSMLNVNPRTQLLQARDILELGLENVSYARQAVALSDGKSIADVNWAKFEEHIESLPKRPATNMELEAKSVISDLTSLDINDEVFSPEPHREATKVEPQPEDQGTKDIPPDGVKGSATAVWNTIKDLHLELMLIYHRVCIKLAIMGPDPAENIQKPFKRDKYGNMEKTESIEDLSSHHIKDYKELLTACRKNSLSKALLFMQKALLLSNDGLTTMEQKQLLQDAVDMIQKAQVEERRIYLENTNVPHETTKPSKLPPPPVLLCRTDSMMVFRPAPFKSEDGQQVAWYRIFARSSTGSNVRVRLNDYYFPGTGEEVPAYGCELRVSGLQPHERYMFAVAAYNVDGQIIGGGVGESTKPILASHPLPVLMTWGFLSQIAYQVGNYNIARQACEVLWGHFIAEPPPPQSVTFLTQSQGDFKLTLMKLNKKVVCQTSPVLLRQFLTSIFIGVDMSVREGQLFCDVVCDKGPLFKGQMKRLHECEKMLVAIELAGWLNEANLALQAVVQCYGLLAPLIFYKIPSVAVVQVLQRCHVVLQEIPAGLRQKRQQSIADSLHHMTACVTYSMAKVLRSWGQKQLANNINEAGRRLLALEGEETKESKKQKESTDVGDKGALSGGETSADDKTDASESVPLHALKKKKTKKTGANVSKEELEGPVNEELKALEAHMLSLSKQAQYEHELSGYEDPSILHAYIAYLPSKLAYREVVKFKRRLRYLEFFVLVAQKALTEGLATQVIDWCDDTSQWLARRNEQIIGMRQYLGKQPGVVTVSGDDPKRFAAAMVEYTKEKDMTTPKIPGTKIQPAKSTTTRPKRRRAYKPIMVTPNMSDSSRQAQEEAELKAIESFSTFFPDMYRQWHKRKKLRKMTVDEMPWRCQLVLLQGLSHFSAFLQRMELRDKVIGTAGMYKTNFLDQEWFAFETAGTMVIGWDGGPSKPAEPHTIVLSGRKRTRVHDSDETDDETETHASNTDALDLAHAEPESRPRTTATGIEIAAAMATDDIEMVESKDSPKSKPSTPTKQSTENTEDSAAPPPMYFFPPEQEDTPRTYRSDISNIIPIKAPPPKEVDHVIITAKETVDSLTKTFSFFRKSIILSHRGQHWTLLQNSCRALWNCAHTALLRAVSSEEDLLTVDELRNLVWHPMYIAADCALDMVVQLQVDLEKQAEKAKSKNRKLGDLFESWTGHITNEKGGASLKFENLLDDTSSTDFRWVRRLILRVIEFLYYEQKWEKLVDIAMRFSALTNNRYAEQVLPILVQSQRQLEARVQSLGGEDPPQSHYRLMMQKLDGVVTAKDYLQNQLMLNIDRSRLPTMPAGAAIDPLGHGVYTYKDGQKTVSVPLDIPLSLQTLREVFDKSQYTSRALQHSRKLLILYLAGQQNGAGGEGFLSRQVSKVEFVPTTARPQPTMPADISKDEYHNMDDILTTAMPRSQLATVISSYEKTIDMLLAKNQKGLAAQAMHELGNLQYHASNIRAAYKWWAESLDYVLNTTDALHTWRDIFSGSEDISSNMLQRCGLWGCILGGVIASNIAQYILTSDLGLRMECCFLSGYFFKALFRSSLPHPTADRDYALYEVGEGCEVTNLVPGVDLLSEKFRADGRQLIAGLRWVSEELARGRHNLFVLPLLTLNQYLTTFVCRDLQRSVDGRILKVRVLTDLALFNEAFIVLQRLLHGERLPHTGDSHFRQVESKMSSLKFNTSKPITEPINLKVLEMVLDKRLSSSLATLYGPHMTCHLSLVQAHLFVSLADTIPVIPHIEEVLLGDGQKELKPFTISTISKGGLGSKGVKLSSSSSGGPKKSSVRSSADARVEVDDDEETDPSSGHIPKRFTHSKKALTLELIKGTLLAVADQMVTTIAEVIQENAEHDKHGLEGIPAAELELVVLCKLQQASIARQKQHAPMAARVILSALKLLKSSQLFKPKKEMPPQRRKKYRNPKKREVFESDERPSSIKGRGGSPKKGSHGEVKLSQPENSQFQYQNFQSRSRLDARLWLDCRAALVKCLMLEVRGLGEIKDPETTVLKELAECRQYCVEGLGEAEACGDVEMQAEFFIQGAILNITEGKSVENTISLLQDAIMLLRKIPKLSIPAEQLLVTALVLQTDLEAIEREDESFLFTERILDQYLETQTLILNQLQKLGEKIEHYYPADQKRHFSSPVSPMRNIYLPQVLRLAQIKFRVGHAMTRNAAKYIRSGTDKDPVQLWVDALGVLMTALQISQASVTREANLEAEILLNLGKVQRMLVYHGKFQSRRAAETLVEAIKTSYCNDHDLGLMRQAYLEIALIYLYSTGMITLKENNSLEFVMDSLEQDASTVRTESNRSKPKSWKDSSSSPDSSKKSSARTKSSKSDEMGENEKERRAAWLAIRCAASIAQSQRSRMLVIGDTSVTSQKLADKAQDDIPDFVALDLISAYVLGEKKKVYKDQIEELLAPLLEAHEVKKVESYEEQVNRAKEGAKELGWIHLLGYQSVLQRLCSTSTISASSSRSDLAQDAGGDLGPEFDLGFISHAQCDTTMNHDVVRSMLFSGVWSRRVGKLHKYFAEHLQIYSADCCGIYPPPTLVLPVITTPRFQLDVIFKSYTQNLTIPADMEESLQPAVLGDPGRAPPPPGSVTDPYKPPDRVITAPSETEVALQFYQPSLEENDPMRLDAMGPESRIFLLFAIYKKTAQPGVMWITLSQLNDLHDRLAVLAQRGEISLQEKAKKEAVTPSPTPTAKSKKVQRIKALSPKVQRDEQLEGLLKQCIEDIGALLGVVSEQAETGTTPEIPFEVSRQNIKLLEGLFDPSFGNTLRGTDMVQWLFKQFV